MSAPPLPFISEDDLSTFEGWLKYQGYEAGQISPDELTLWRDTFDEVTQSSSVNPKVGLMKLGSIPGEYRYAVAFREGDNLWLTLWIKRSRKGEFFVMLPRRDCGWDPHTSYHLDGTVHSKSYGHKFPLPRKLPALTSTFAGTAHLGAFGGHGPKSVGAICDPTAFNGVVEVPHGVLGPRNGSVVVDLVEPGCQPLTWFSPVVHEAVFRDFVPWVVIRISHD